MDKLSKYGLYLGTFVGAAIGFIGAFYYLTHHITTPVKGIYYAYDPAGVMRRLNPPLHEPHNEDKIVQWIKMVTEDVFFFGYHNYQIRLQSATKYYTKDGWTTFATYLQNAELINKIERKQLTVKAKLMSDPVLIHKGASIEKGFGRIGRYRWQYEVPVDVFYFSKGDIVSRDKLYMTLFLERVPTLENKLGVAIDEIKVRQRDG